MLIAEKFIRSLVQKYGKYTVYTDGGTWYDEACNVIGLKHYLHSAYQKSLMEKVNQYLKERIESFDDYYLFIEQKNRMKCDLQHVYNRIKLFIYLYNTKLESNFYSILEVRSS